MAFFKSLKQSLQNNFQIFRRKKRSSSLPGNYEGQDDETESQSTTTTRQQRSKSVDTGRGRVINSTSQASRHEVASLPDVDDDPIQQSSRTSSVHHWWENKAEGCSESHGKASPGLGNGKTSPGLGNGKTSPSLGKSSDKVARAATNSSHENQAGLPVDTTIPQLGEPSVGNLLTLKEDGLGGGGHDPVEPGSDVSDKSLDRKIDQYLSELERLVFREWPESQDRAPEVPVPSSKFRGGRDQAPLSGQTSSNRPQENHCQPNRLSRPLGSAHSPKMGCGPEAQSFRDRFNRLPDSPIPPRRQIPRSPERTKPARPPPPPPPKPPGSPTQPEVRGSQDKRNEAETRSRSLERPVPGSLFAARSPERRSLQPQSTEASHGRDGSQDRRNFTETSLGRECSILDRARSTERERGGFPLLRDQPPDRPRSAERPTARPFNTEHGHHHADSHYSFNRTRPTSNKPFWRLDKDGEGSTSFRIVSMGGEKLKLKKKAKRQAATSAALQESEAETDSTEKEPTSRPMSPGRHNRAVPTNTGSGRDHSSFITALSAGRATEDAHEVDEDDDEEAGAAVSANTSLFSVTSEGAVDRANKDKGTLGASEKEVSFPSTSRQPGEAEKKTAGSSLPDEDQLEEMVKALKKRGSYGKKRSRSRSRRSRPRQSCENGVIMSNIRVVQAFPTRLRETDSDDSNTSLGSTPPPTFFRSLPLVQGGTTHPSANAACQGNPMDGHRRRNQSNSSFHSALQMSDDGLTPQTSTAVDLPQHCLRCAARRGQEGEEEGTDEMVRRRRTEEEQEEWMEANQGANNRNREGREITNVPLNVVLQDLSSYGPEEFVLDLFLALCRGTWSDIL